MYVRQHYKLATTGKLGQNASGKGAPKSSGKMSSGSMKKSGSYGSHSSKGRSRV